MCVVSAQSFPLASLVEISRWTVTRAEILIWGLWLGKARVWHDIVYQRLNHVRALQDARDSNEHTARPSSNTAIVVDDDHPPVNHSELQPFCEDLKIPTNVTPNAWNVGCTYFSGDATNSSIWQRQKLQGLEVVSSMVVDVDALSQSDYKKAFNRLQTLILVFAFG